MTKAILAVDNYWAIGKSDSPSGLPWPNISEDFKHFQKHTKEMRNLIVGRKTYEILFQLTNGKLLVGRNLFVISRTLEKDTPNITVCRSIIEASNLLENENKIFGGGKQVYEKCVGLLDEIILTKVHSAYEADCYINPFIFDGFKEDVERQEILRQVPGKPLVTAHYFIRK